MRLLDLFCGAGGAAMGYHRAGFDVVGVDIKPQPHYPFEFHQADAMTYPLDGIDAIHASPPCQYYSWCTPQKNRQNHPDLIEAVRLNLINSWKPYVIENVAGARKKMVHPIMLCGSMFGLPIQRHRYFETSFQISVLLPCCNHSKVPVYITGTPRRKGHKRCDPPAEVRRKAMGVPWMSIKDMDEAIPPIYTEWIGTQLMKHIRESMREKKK